MSLAGLRSSTPSRPSLEQIQGSLLLLHDRNPHDVFAWIKFVRSLNRKHQHQAGNSDQQRSNLSAEQLDAIKILSRCEDHEVHARLFENLSSFVTVEASAFSFPDSSNHLPVLENVDPSIETPPCSHQSAILVKDPRPYHCTRCEKSYKNDFDWKRHEKEHEFWYECMPNGWLHSARKCHTCVFCDERDPDEQHASTHNTTACNFRCKRRDLLTNHLNKSHGVSNPQRRLELAVSWKRGTGRKFWSCGFCTSLFSTLTDRLRHIDVEHYRSRQKIQDWDITKVIKGLLTQRDVCDAWEAGVKARHTQDHPEAVWQISKVGALQFMLELGPSDKHSAASLAKFAYEAITIGGEPQISRNDVPESADAGHSNTEGIFFPFSSRLEGSLVPSRFADSGIEEPDQWGQQGSRTEEFMENGNRQRKPPAISDSTSYKDASTLDSQSDPFCDLNMADAVNLSFALDDIEQNAVGRGEASDYGFANPNYSTEVEGWENMLEF